MDDPLYIGNEMRALDRKQRDWFDRLEPEHQRKFSPFLMIRFGSSVEGTTAWQQYYVLSVNERLNKHFFSISAKDHKKFLWLMATTVSPDEGTPRHPWIAPRPKEKNSKEIQMLRKMRPDLREDEINLLAQLNTAKDIREAYDRHGSQD